MFERVKAFFDTHDIRPDACTVLVAVSGGLDSMTLVDVLRKMGFQLGVAHMNYGLRGEASEADEAFVQAYCKAAEVPFHTRKATISDGGESIQMQARTLRYNWFAELLSSFDYTYLATAHHLNDSLESTLLHLSKGTGLTGLTGITELSDQLIRPLSQASRAEIVVYAQTHALHWREDASNAESKYQRNKIRNGVVPVLEEINPSIVDTFRHTLERLQGAHALLEKEVARIKRVYGQSGEYDRLDMEWFEENALGWTLLSELLKPYGVSYQLAKEIGTHHASGARFLTESHELVYDRHALVITHLTRKSTDDLHIAGEGHFTWGRWHIHVDRVGVVDFEKSTDANKAYFDLAAMEFPIKVRTWHEGDWFVPLGMTGKKKLSDFMIDHKIALTLKTQIPLFTTRKGIFWVGGYRIDDRFKVTGKSKELICIKLAHGD